MRIQENFTEKTEILYSELISVGYAIEFNVDAKYESELRRSNACFGMIPNGNNKFQIVTYLDTPNIPAFTHELLHINLFRLGFQSTDKLKNSFSFSTDFINSMNNTLAHSKMINDFLNLGFSQDNFLNVSIEQIINERNNELSVIDYLGVERSFWLYFDTLCLHDIYCQNNDVNQLLENLEKSNTRLFFIAVESFGFWKKLSNSDNRLFYKFLQEKFEANEISVNNGNSAMHSLDNALFNSSNAHCNLEVKRNKLLMEIGQLQAEYASTNNSLVKLQIDSKLQELQLLDNASKNIANQLNIS
jgi:hypothetical protein